MSGTLQKVTVHADNMTITVLTVLHFSWLIMV